MSEKEKTSQINKSEKIKPNSKEKAPSATKPPEKKPPEKKHEKIQLFSRKFLTVPLPDALFLYNKPLHLIGEAEVVRNNTGPPTISWVYFCEPRWVVSSKEQFPCNFIFKEKDIPCLREVVDFWNLFVKSINETSIVFSSENEDLFVKLLGGKEWGKWEKKILKWGIQTNFNEKYVMRKEIGSGGYASVYLVSKRKDINEKQKKKEEKKEEENNEKAKALEKKCSEKSEESCIRNGGKGLENLRMKGVMSPKFKDCKEKGETKQEREEEDEKKTIKMYATKVVKKQKLNSDTRRRYMKQEIEIMRELNHPNIIKLHEVFETRNHLFLVLEYHSGGDLYHKCRQGIFTEDEAICIIKQVAKALQYLKSKKIIHRDLKTANILISGNRKMAIVSDFGLALRENKESGKKDRSGTVGYMGPEILSKNWDFGPPTTKSDIFSLGVVAYEMYLFIICKLFGFLNRTHGTTLIKGGKYKEIYEKNAQWNTKVESNVLSKELLDLINKALESDPSKRVDIEQFLNHDVFSFEISDSEDFQIAYDPSKSIATKFKADLDNRYTPVFLNRFMVSMHTEGAFRLSRDSRDIGSESVYEEVSFGISFEKSNYFGRGCSRNNSSLTSKPSGGHLHPESEENDGSNLNSTYLIRKRKIDKRSGFVNEQIPEEESLPKDESLIKNEAEVRKQE